jgi:prepilin-type N-terminal cleavage/methylation domain-containing protein
MNQAFATAPKHSWELEHGAIAIIVIATNRHFMPTWWGFNSTKHLSPHRPESEGRDRGRSIAQARPSRGFTLVELLVSLAVFAIAMGLMSGALFQSAKLLERIERGNDQLIDEWRSMRALQEAVANMRAPRLNTGAQASTLATRGPRVDGLAGTEDQFAVWTVRHPLAEEGRVARLEARVAASGEGPAQWLLRVAALPGVQGRFLPASSDRAARTGNADGGVLAVVPVGTRFRYQDIEGGWHTRWPVSGREREALPRAIALIEGEQNRLLAVWPFGGQVVESELAGGSFLEVVEATR